MGDAEFDETERIGGFRLVEIKGALFHVGLVEKGDPVSGLAKTLKCGRPQAERVLAAMVKRGLLQKTGKKDQCEWTELGRRLALSWHPPRRLEPAIYRDDDDATSESFDSVPCSIIRLQGDDEMLEEADLMAGVYVDLESDRVVEIEVMQPDDYEHRDEGGSVVDTTVLLSVADAKRFAEALQKAIARGEAEIARRATVKPRKKKRTAVTAKPAETAGAKPSTTAAARSPSSAATSNSKAGNASKGADKVAPARAKLAATLKELGGVRRK